MKIRSQILLAQLPTASIILFITAFFILTLNAIEYRSESILVDNFKSILSMQKLENALEDLNLYILHHQKPFNGEIQNIETIIEQDLITQEKAPKETEEEEDLTKTLRQKWELYKDNIHSLSADKNKSEQLYKELKQVISSIIGLNQDYIIRKKDDLSSFIINYRLFISSFALVSLMLGFYLSWVFTGLFLNPLNKMIEIVSQFGKTDETTLLHIKGSEEIQKLSDEFNLMTARLEEFHQSSLGHIIEDYEKLKKVFEVFPDSLLFFDDKSNLIFLNRSALNLFGISGSTERKNPLVHIEKIFKESLLKIVKEVLLTGKAHIPEKTEEPLSIFKNKQKLLFFPFAYPIKDKTSMEFARITGVFIILQDLTRHSLSALETGQILKTFLHDFQEPLSEIQMALHICMQESIGPLNEKQKEILYTARENCSILEKLYQDFHKISPISSEN